jgi:hypothetical protein
MQGILTKNSESDDDYKERLALLSFASNAAHPYNYTDYEAKYGSLPLDVPKDGRFSRWISTTGNTSVTGIGVNATTSAKGTADFSLAIKESGYPVVALNNGLTNIIDYMMQLTLNKSGNSYEPHFKDYLRQEYEPFDDAASHGIGSTVLLTLPVIWSSNCEDTNFINGYYVGTANFLLTRIWDSINSSYDNGDESIAVSINNSPTGECASRFVGDYASRLGFFGNIKQDYILPDLTSGELRSITGFTNKSFEGVLLDPTKGPEFPAGIRRIQLVE